MFDRLIASEPQGAGARSRRNYFLVSTLAVVVLVMTAVVASIFAEEVGLGTDNFELAVLLPPVEMPAAQPQPPRPRTPATQSPAASSDQLPSRQVNMARTDEPTIVPTTTSTAANTQLSRPDYSRYKVNGIDSDTAPSGDQRGRGGNANAGTALTPENTVAANEPEKDEPPVRKPEPPRQSTVVTRGVVNGQATYLPKPAYPKPAMAIRVEGKVDVQVVIDESGRVVSAKAVSGNPLLRPAAENAARIARFTPTKLSDVPVKVTGVIVYNFNLS